MVSTASEPLPSLPAGREVGKVAAIQICPLSGRGHDWHWRTLAVASGALV